MANTTNTRHTCADCGFYSPEFMMCKKANVAARPKNYACNNFATLEELKALYEARKAEYLKKQEHRLNFLLTGLYIQSSATMQMLEYFDTQWTDRKAESNWRFKRKQAAREIDRCVQRIRDLYQHNFMEDQTQVMTAHGTKAFDAESWDNHENDARRWNLYLLHHMETSWQDDGKEAEILKFYESLPRVGIFHPKDFNHFTTKR